MVKYTVKRLLILIPILIGVAFIIFTIMDFTPGDPAIRILGPESSVEAREQLRVELGLDQPFWIRFLSMSKMSSQTLTLENHTEQAIRSLKIYSTEFRSALP